LSLFVDDPTCKKPQGIYKNITQTIKWLQKGHTWKINMQKLILFPYTVIIQK
jgi:hypothetical protein